MRLIGSLVFLIGAFCVGAYSYFPLRALQQGRLLDFFLIEASVTAPEAAPSQSAKRALGRSFAPQASVLTTLVNALSTMPQVPPEETPTPPDRLHAAQSALSGVAPEPRADNAWRSVVAERTSAARQELADTDSYMARYRLARRLQTELARVGCYRGDIDGDWGPGSKRAAAAFLRKVNATLPTETPDYILLTLIEGHVDRACGVECPSGQGLAFDGRCLPNVIVAGAPEQGTPLGQKTLGAKSTKKSWMSGTRVTQAPVPTPAPRTQGLAQQLAQSAQSSAMASARGALVSIQPAHAIARPSPLPDMMSVGAPPPSPGEIRPAEPLAVAATGVVSVPPAPARAALQRALPRQAKPTVDVGELDDSADGYTADSRPAERVNDPFYKAGAIRSDAKRGTIARPAPVRASAPHKARAAKSERHRRYGRDVTVRTSVGRVRSDSPQHNLMQSLGGVF